MRAVGNIRAGTWLAALLAVAALGRARSDALGGEAVTREAPPATAAASPPVQVDGGAPLFVRLGPRTIGALYSPRELGPEASVGLVVMHPNSDFLSHPSCTELSARGFRVLCVNGQYANTKRETMIWERVPLDVKPAVAYLRQLPGIERVVLLGHSGGGQLMPFYQNVAENGVAACQVPGRIGQCSDALRDLPPADGLLLLDAHFGYGAIVLSSLDPAVTDEANPAAIDPALDLFDPANGYDPAGAHYSEEFKRRYYRAQTARLDRLTALALARREAIEAGRGAYPDDEAFPIARQDARLWQADLSLISRTKGAYPVLYPDGSVAVEVPHTVRVPSLDARRNASFGEGTVVNTVESFLSAHTIRTTPEYYVTEDSIEGVDWDSSNTSTPANLAGVHVPLLIMAMTGHYWMVPSEIFYDRSASPDKTLVFVQGATHGFTPCRPCERTPGEFGDTMKTTFDYAAAWLRERFVPNGAP